MKKIFSFILASILTIGFASAQDFNGKIVYTMSAVGEGAEQVAAYLPESMSMTYLKKDMIMEMKGGMVAMMMGKILVKGKKGKAYMIKDAEETIYTMSSPKEEEKEEEGPKPDIKKTGETEEIAGYTCSKYEITTEGPEGPVTSYAWATDKIHIAKGKGGGMSGMGMGSMSMEGIPGHSLKMQFSQGPFTMVIKAKSVDTTPPSKKLFKLPKGYDKEEFDPSIFGGGGGGGGGMGY